MEQPASFPVDLPLIRRIELCSGWRKANYAAGFAMLNPGAQPVRLITAGGLAVYASSHSVANGAVGLGLSRPVTPEDIDAVEELFFSRDAPCVIAACPFADPSLQRILKERGYRELYQHSVLARNILTQGSITIPPGLRIQRADGINIEKLILASALGFDKSAEPSRETIEILGPNIVAPSSAFFAACEDEQIIATGGMYWHEGVVEMGGASTIPTHRRRGAHRALLEARMDYARSLGCDLAILLTEPGSASEQSAKRAGFSRAYVDIIWAKQ